MQPGYWCGLLIVRQQLYHTLIPVARLGEVVGLEACMVRSQILRSAELVTPFVVVFLELVLLDCYSLGGP